MCAASLSTLPSASTPQPPDRHLHRVLFVAPTPPRLDATDGGSRMMAQLIAALADRHQVAVIYLRHAHQPKMDSVAARCAVAIDVPHPRATSFLGRRRREARLLLRLAAGRPLWSSRWAVPGFDSALHALVRDWAPDVIQFETHVMAQYARTVRSFAAARILHQHEPGTAAAHVAWRTARGVRRLVAHLDCVAWRRYERQVVEDVDHVVVLTRRDRRAMERLGAATPISRIPFGTIVPPVALNPVGAEPFVLFVGGFGHYPNVDAAQRLLLRIFPRVVARYPAARLCIVGSAPPSSLFAAGCPGATIIGDVADVTPYLDRAAVVAAPLRLGGGMRVKVIEALAAGKAVVCSRRAAEGLDVHDGTHVRFAASDDEFADAIAGLLDHPYSRRALATRAREWAAAHASWTPVVTAYEQLYAALTGARSHSVPPSE